MGLAQLFLWFIITFSMIGFPMGFMFVIRPRLTIGATAVILFVLGAFLMVSLATEPVSAESVLNGWELGGSFLGGFIGQFAGSIFGRVYEQGDVY